MDAKLHHSHLSTLDCRCQEDVLAGAAPFDLAEILEPEKVEEVHLLTWMRVSMAAHDLHRRSCDLNSNDMSLNSPLKGSLCEALCHKGSLIPDMI